MSLIEDLNDIRKWPRLKSEPHVGDVIAKMDENGKVYVQTLTEDDVRRIKSGLQKRYGKGTREKDGAEVRRGEE